MMLSTEITILLLQHLLVPVKSLVSEEDLHEPITSHLALVEKYVLMSLPQEKQKQEDKEILNRILSSVPSSFFDMKLTLEDILEFSSGGEEEINENNVIAGGNSNSRTTAAAAAAISPIQLSMLSPLFQQEVVTREDVEVALSSSSSSASSSSPNSSSPVTLRAVVVSEDTSNQQQEQQQDQEQEMMPLPHRVEVKKNSGVKNEINNNNSQLSSSSAAAVSYSSSKRRRKYYLSEESKISLICDTIFLYSNSLPGTTFHHLVSKLSSSSSSSSVSNKNENETLTKSNPQQNNNNNNSNIHRVHYIHKFAEAMVRSQWKSLTTIPYLIFFIITLYLIANKQNVWNIYTMWHAAQFPTTDDWSNSCSNTVTNPCTFLKKTAPDIGTETEALQYLRVELPKQLWGWHSGSSAAELPYGSAWLVGAAILRSSLQTGVSTNRTEYSTVKSCSEVNLTEPISEVMIGQQFSCDVTLDLTLPFSKTLLETLTSTLTSFTVFIPETADAVASLQYGMYQPNDGLLTWVTAQVAIPTANSYTFRSHVRVIDLDFKDNVIVALFCFQLVLTIISVFGNVIYRFVLFSSSSCGNNNSNKILGSSNTFTLCLQITQLILIASAYGLLLSLPHIQDELYQTSYVIKNFDTVAARFDIAVSLFGFWTLFFLLQLILYMSEFDSVSVVFSLLKIAGPDVIFLIAIFAFIFLGFVMSAMIFFGASEDTFSYISLAVAHLIQYVFGSAENSYEKVSTNFPILGVLYHYVLSLFVVFFWLNLLVSALTAPLSVAREQADLHLEMFSKANKRLPVRHKKSGKIISPLNWFVYSNISVPLVPFIFDMFCWFIPPSTNLFFYWIKAHQALSILDDNDDNCDNKERISEILWAVEILQTIANEVSKQEEKMFVVESSSNKKKNSSSNNNLYESLLLATVEQHEVFPTKYATTLKFIKFLCVAESSFDTIRDARLAVALKSFDEIHTKFTKQRENFQNQMESRKTDLQEIEQSCKKDLVSTSGNNHNNNAASIITTIATQEKEEEETENERNFENSNNNNSNNNSNNTAFAYESIIDEEEEEETRKNSSSSSSENTNNNDNKFFFTSFFIKEIRYHLLFFVFLIIVLICYLLFTVNILKSRQTVAYMSSNLHAALRDYPFLQYCDDVNCTSGFTHHKTFRDNGHLKDVYQYLDLLLVPQLFPASPSYVFSLFYASDPVNSPVLWNQYMRRIFTITVRQIRGKEIPCKTPTFSSGFSRSLSSEETIQQNRMNQLKCYSDDEYTTSGFDRPASSILPASAYQYQHDTCAELVKTPVIGHHRSYPCEGFIANVSTKAELQYMKTWLDNATRFVSITAQFDIDDAIKAQYSLYAELSQSGGTGFFWSLSEPVLETQPLHEYAPAGYALLAASILRSLISIPLNSCGGGYFFCGRGEIPWFQMCFALLLLIVGVIPSVRMFWRETVNAGLIAMYLTQQFLYAVIFPISQLLTTRATSTLRVFNLALSATLQVIPLFVVIFIAFLFSGHALLGRYLLSFASLRNAAATIGKGYLGDWDLQEQFNEDVAVGLCFTTFFTCVVIITLANLILSVINGAAEEAHQETRLTEVVDSVVNCHHDTGSGGNSNNNNNNEGGGGDFFIMSGPLLKCYLAWHIYFNNSNNNSDSNKNSSSTKGTSQYFQLFTLTGEFPRTLSPLECLLPFLGSRRTSELLKELKFELLPIWIQPSVIALIISVQDHFRREKPALLRVDERTENGEEII